MERIIQIGRFLFGIAIAAFGVENLICARLGLMEDIGFGKIIDVIPWVPPNAFLPYGDCASRCRSMRCDEYQNSAGDNSIGDSVYPVSVAS
jgi:hypothetical protein